VIRRSVAVSLSAVLAFGMAPAANAAPGESPVPDSWPEPESAPATLVDSAEKGTVLSLGERSGRELYVVQLEDAPVPSYTGGVRGLAPVKTATRTFRPEGARESDYRSYLARQQSTLRSDIAERTGRAPQVRFTYTEALNGIAVSLTREEAKDVAELDGVVAVQVDELRELQTDVGPEWIGAPSIWDGSATTDGSGTQGEGVVAGILDSGINAANPSFADSVSQQDGGDGYDHTNPRGSGNYVGVCDPANAAIYNPDFECNDKLIGAWDFAPGDDADVGYAYDEDGHGTHTASTTAGNQLAATTYSAEEDPEDRFSATRTIKGVAPHANVIAYDVCDAGCPLTAIVAGINQAIVDEVDTINYSIGSTSPGSSWTDPDALGFLNARAAGIHVATSAGNSGPGAATVGSPADAPWMTSVGATQHNRQWRASVEDITADGEALDDIAGLGFANPTDASYPVVDGTDLGSRLCLANELAGQDLAGQIVLCERGVTGRVEKGEVVADRGAEGMILMNDAASGDSLNADPHALPAVHITHDDGVALRQVLAGNDEVTASLSGGQEYVGDDVADIMAAFSSRGPNRAIELISPSISAPGVDILAGNGRDNEVSWGFISGTSMASPHVAGALTLLAADRPGWTPAEAQSALMTTAVTEITDNDGTPADWFDMGSGRVDLTKAAQAGLVLDETEQGYLAANPTLGGDVKELNTASMADAQCVDSCSWTRTVTATDAGDGVAWTAQGVGVTDGIDLTVEPSTFTLAEGETQEITVTADVTGSERGAYQFGNVVLTPAEAADTHEAHLPVAAQPSNGSLPAEIDIDTRRDAGSEESEPIEAVEISDFTAEAQGLVPETTEELSVPQDTTNDDPYDGNGTEVVVVDAPEGATRLIASLRNATAPDFDLYVGTGDTPSPGTEVAYSASGGSAETVDIPLGDDAAEQYWILVQNWEASDADEADTVDLGYAVVAGDEQNLRAEGPDSVSAGEPFTIRTFWDERRMGAGQTWYGSLTLRDAAGDGNEIGTIPVTVNRFADDVTKTADVETAAPGETITYTVDIAPNVTPEDLTYTIEDQLPAGTTYVEGSATNGATHEDGVISWQGEMPSPEGVEKKYDVTSSLTDESCVHPFTGQAEFVDLGALGIPADPAIQGDSVTFNAFSSDSFGFYEGNYRGLTFTDDGFLVYGDGNKGGNPFINQQIPNPALPNNLAAALWQDMQLLYDKGSDAGVRIAAAGDLKVLQFDGMRLAGDKSGRLGTTDFQVAQVAGSRDLAVAFDNVDGPVDNVTIGTENATGTAGTALVNRGDAGSVIADGTVVCMTYNTLLDPAQFTYQVTVDDGAADGQVLRNVLLHDVDNPGARPEQLTHEVVVEGATVEPEPKDPRVTVVTKRDAKEPNRDGVLRFRRSGDISKRLEVPYRLRGSAVKGKDYRADGVAVFARGDRRVRELIKVINRPGKQGVRVVRVRIRNSEDYVAGDPRVAKVRILDKGKNR
jgi:uncharacterized repeat protein (TIGR01451 family)